MSPYARKVDGNQSAIVAALRARGYLVRANKTGDGAEDLVVSRPTWRVAVLLEVKKGRGKLTEKQVKALGVGWPVYVVRDTEQALRILDVIEQFHTSEAQS